MTTLNPTRMNLINLKRRVVIAKKGHDILKKKREVLVIEFMKMLKQSSESRSKLNEQVQGSYNMVETASTYVGNFELEEVALHMKQAAPIRMKIKNIMGVRIPVIERTQGAQAYSILFSTSLAVDDINETFTSATNSIIDVAQREQGLKRLVLEIDKTKRRVNALDYKVIPDMMDQSKYIRMHLDEMEREMFAGLKHVKKKLSTKNKS